MANQLIRSPISDTYVIEDTQENRLLVRAVYEETHGRVFLEVPLPDTAVHPSYRLSPDDARELAARLLDSADFADGLEGESSG